jgi:hypothetical protein
LRLNALDLRVGSARRGHGVIRRILAGNTIKQFYHSPTNRDGTAVNDGRILFEDV